jgi:hypothetical protein
MKSLLHKHFTRTAEHHVKKAEHHAVIASHASGLLAMHKAEGLDTEALDDLLQRYIDSHAAIADEHQSMAEHCTECAKTCAASGKAMGDEIMPTLISLIAPESPAQRVRAVPRFGAPPLQKTEVDEKFAHLVRVSDEESGD